MRFRTKKRSALGGVLLSLSVAMSLSVAAAAAEPSTASSAILSGRLTNEAGKPIADAVVRVAIPATDMRFVDPASDHRQLEVRTGADGTYEFEIPGISRTTRVSLDAMKPGFRRLVGTLMSGGDVTDLDMSPGTRSRANLVLKPAAYFKGVVVDEAGRPIAGVKVGAKANSPQASGGVERTATREDGSFEIFSYPIEPPQFKGVITKGEVGFFHPDFIEASLPDVYGLPPFERITLWIVLNRGHRLGGQVLEAAGRPVPNVMVRALTPADSSNRKAVLTNGEGRFELPGLTPGAKLLSVYANDIEQKAEMPLVVVVDQADLVVQLQKMAIEAPPRTYEVLGMRLADMTPELKAAFGLHQGRGALIMDPGSNSVRLKIGELAKGYFFWEVGDSEVGSVREFVEQILKEAESQSTGRSTARRLLDRAVETATGESNERFSIRVVYSLSTLAFDGTNTQYLDLSRDDIEQLKAVLREMPKPKYGL